MKFFQVGGSVRDSILGIGPADLDYVVIGSTIEDLLNLGFEQVGSTFPVFLHPKTKHEYALARTEQKCGVGHTGFVCAFSPNITLEDDLLRRDLTINAIAMNESGTFIDPYGGIDDINNKILRHVSQAFSDDPLRVLRVARFMARFYHLGFTVADETLDLMRSIAKSGELSSLTPERIWKELSRAITEKTPSQFFLTLKKADCLKEIFPEIDNLFRVEQNAEHHPEIDAGIHTMMVVDRARELTDNLSVITSALLHDLGKGLTPKNLWPKHINHESNGIPVVASFCNRLKIPNSIQTMAIRVCEHHLRCHRVLDMRPGKILNLIESLDGIRNPDNVNHFTLACMADAQGRLGFKEKPYPQRKFLIDALNLAIGVNSAPYIEKGLKGKEIGQAMRNEMLIRISNICNQAPLPDDQYTAS